MTPPETRPVRGIFWMIVTGVLFVAVTATVKHIGSTLPAAEMAFLRYLLGLVFILPMIPALREAEITRRHMYLFSLRGAVHALGIICWFYAMTRITIAEVTAMNYMAPIYVTIGAALFLGERLAARRIVAIVVAFLGAMIILRPGFREISSGHIAMLVAPLLMGGGYLIAKRLTNEVPPVAIVAWLSIIVPVVKHAIWVTVAKPISVFPRLSCTV